MNNYPIGPVFRFSLEQAGRYIRGLELGFNTRCLRPVVNGTAHVPLVVKRYTHSACGLFSIIEAPQIREGLMKKSIVVATLALSSCTYIPAPQPAPVTGDLPAKVEARQLNQSAREQLGAHDKSDLIIRVGADGSVTLFSAPGLGFSVKKSEDDMPGTQALQNKENKLAEKGVVSKFTVTMKRNSPACAEIFMAGRKIYGPVPDCPHPDQSK